MRRVVITGIGIVSPLGNDRDSTWQSVVAGRSGAAPITQFDATSWPTTFACEVRNFSLPENAAADATKFLNRPGEFGVTAALEAVEDSRIDFASIDPFKIGVSIGSGIGAVSPQALAKLLAGLNLDRGTRDLTKRLLEASDVHLLLQNHPGTLAAVLSSRWQAKGPVNTIHTACASSGQSMGHAYLQIKRGDCDVMIAGGADSLAGELLLAGFCLIGALSTRNDDPQAASRPFDKGRDGFVASEGAAMMILEERELAIERGAKIYGEISGYGETESAYRITDLPPDGRGIVEAMQLALKEADLTGLDYINAHGTSTELNDRIEALSIKRVFGEGAEAPLVSSTKSETGHLISAAGALELAFCALAIKHGEIPPNINLEHSDCADGLNLVANEKIARPIQAAMSNSIGFGGTNTSLVVERHRL